MRRRGARRVRRRDSRRPAAPRTHRGGRLGKAADDSSRIKRHGRSRARAYLAAERGRGPGAERRRDGVDGRHRKCLRERECDAGARGARSISLATLGSWPYAHKTPKQIRSRVPSRKKCLSCFGFLETRSAVSVAPFCREKENSAQTLGRSRARNTRRQPIRRRVSDVISQFVDYKVFLRRDDVATRRLDEILALRERGGDRPRHRVDPG